MCVFKRRAHPLMELLSGLTRLKNRLNLDPVGKFGFLANNRRASNPLFLIIQLVIAKCGAALPHQARIERLAQVRKLQIV